ncbi:MAG: ectoine hydroxylase [Planctomycetota bacterium]|jgi:ectoine hydroxylase
MTLTVRAFVDDDREALLALLREAGVAGRSSVEQWGRDGWRCWLAEEQGLVGVLLCQGGALELLWGAHEEARSLLLERAKRGLVELLYVGGDSSMAHWLGERGFEQQAGRLRWQRWVLSEAQAERYEADGYLVVPGLFTSAEAEHVLAITRQDRSLGQHAFCRSDGEGGAVELALWNHPGDGALGRVACSERVVDRVEQLLGGEAYHYHSKLIQKNAGSGGAWAWHQDFGYWYENGLLFPDLCSVFLALEPATRENGCLQVIRGSQRIGRIEHQLTGDQAGANLEQVQAARQRLETVHVELEPGDALFFHPNLLHRSDRNRSDHSRWALICCYNAATNNPIRESHHPSYTPLHKVADGALLESLDAGAEDFLDPNNDKSASKEP